MAKEKTEQIFKNFKKKKQLHYILTIIIFATAFFAMWHSNNRNYFTDEAARSYIIYAIWTVSIGSLIGIIVSWRCPSCNRYLGNSMNPKSCPKCKTQLR